jgi:hypothetical protein
MHASVDQSGDAASDDSRFAGAGSGKNLQRTFEVFDGFSLRRRQAVEKIGDCRVGRTGI